MKGYIDTPINQTYYIEVSDNHTLYVEECGNPNGKPVIFLHGGPGGLSRNCRVVSLTQVSIELFFSISVVVAKVSHFFL
ncbi:hypothetical protein NHG28_04160 [Aerococcaceae bacterium NML201209]|nr:hypothetical protein [Aerococcaceae bacterium NML201209]MCW6677362.1 hypothetical protein [Aerococcaceae bacterium NML180378]